MPCVEGQWQKLDEDYKRDNAKEAQYRARLPAVWLLRAGGGPEHHDKQWNGQSLRGEVAKITRMGPAAKCVAKQENGATEPKKHLPISRLFAPNPRHCS